MKQVVFYASLTGFLTLIPEGTQAETRLIQEGFPLMFFVEGKTEAYQVQQNGRGEIEQQHQLYTGSTIKPFHLVWFHLGMASRTTKSSGVNEVFLDPATFHFASGMQLVPNFLYVSGGMTLPLSSRQIDINDSDQVYEMINGYTSLSESNPLSMNILSLGTHAQRSIGDLSVKLGFMYFKPSTYELYSDIKSFPASFMNYRLEMIWLRPDTYHRLEGKLTQFGVEKDRELSDFGAHREGKLLQIRYALRLQGNHSGTEYGVGGSWQFKDRSRVNLAEERLVEEGENSNIQRAFFDWTWIQSISRTALMTANIAPQMLYKESAKAIGYQLEISPSIKVKGDAPRFLRITATGILGRLGDENILGGMIKISYAFHRQRR